MTDASPQPEAHGWRILAHPALLDQLEALEKKVARLRARHPDSYRGKAATKRLRAVLELMFDRIPQDPIPPEYRQGRTLGPEHRHWFRATFFQQYRLFFRYDQRSRIIIYGWVNDERTKRAYESRTDAYHTFERMLDRGNPPTSWEELLAEAETALSRLRKSAPKR